jgi:hypothetical protein
VKAAKPGTHPRQAAALVEFFLLSQRLAFIQDEPEYGQGGLKRAGVLGRWFKHVKRWIGARCRSGADFC